MVNSFRSDNSNQCTWSWDHQGFDWKVFLAQQLLAQNVLLQFTLWNCQSGRIVFSYIYSTYCSIKRKPTLVVTLHFIRVTSVFHFSSFFPPYLLLSFPPYLLLSFTPKVPNHTPIRVTSLSHSQKYLLLKYIRISAYLFY